MVSRYRRQLKNFDELLDVEAYSGNALKALRLNAGETALEFYTASGGSSTFTGLTDTPANFTGASLKSLRANVGETALEFYVPPSIVDTFTGLTDTPANFTGSSLKHARVNVGETALEYIDPPTIVDTFTGLTDTPANFTGQTLKGLRVNAGETALEYVALGGGSGLDWTLVCNSNGNTFADTNAGINSAISDLSGGYGWVWMPPTLKTISTTIVVPELTELFSSGGHIGLTNENYGCVLIADTGLNADIISGESTSYLESVYLHGFAINGKGSLQAGGLSRGIDLEQPIRCNLDRLQVRYCETDGIRLGDANLSFDNWVTRCFVADNVTGIRTYTSEENHFIANRTGGNSARGMYLGSGINRVNDHVSVYDYNAFEIGSVGRTVISNSTIDRPDSDAIKITDGNLDTILDNIVIIDPSYVAGTNVDSAILTTGTINRLIVDKLMVVKTGAGTVGKYIFELATVNTLIFGKRNLQGATGASNYGTAMFSAYPSNLKMYPMHTLVSGTSSALGTTSNEYITVSGLASATTSSTARRLKIGRNSLLSNLRVKLDVAPTGATKNRVFTLYKNGAPTSLVVTITDTATVGSDLVNKVLITADDFLQIMEDPANTPLASFAYCSLDVIDFEDLA